MKICHQQSTGIFLDFEDFISSGRRAIEPYIPCKSLLFHGLASPNVHPGPSDSPVGQQRCLSNHRGIRYTGNFIFSTEHSKSGVALRDQAFFASNFILDNLLVVVFAYQYRPGARAVDGRYADFAFSRKSRTDGILLWLPKERSVRFLIVEKTKFPSYLLDMVFS